MRVFKYPLRVGDNVIQCLKPVHVGADPSGEICVWVEDSDNNTEWNFRIFGTGHDVPINMVHIGSFTMNEYVWHVYAEHNFAWRQM